MKIAITVLITALLAACSTTPKSNATSTTAAVSTVVAPVTQANGTLTPLFQGNALNNSPALPSFETQALTLTEHSVYFDFDQSQIKPEYLGIIKKQAEFALAHQKDIITLEGNADERGSNEYNLALGNRRANTVRKNLEILGVANSNIQVVSLGEEKPRYTCHEENCWQKNRRVDFAHQLKP